MRIVFLSPVGVIGGAERLLIDLIYSLRVSRPQWDLQVVAPSLGPLSEALSKLAVVVHVVPIPPSLARIGQSATANSLKEKGTDVVQRLLKTSFTGLAYIRSLRRVLCSIRPTVLHSNGIKMHLLACWATPRHVPVTWHLHEYLSSRTVVRRLIQLHTPKCSAAVAISQSVYHDARRVCGKRLKIETILNAIDLAEFSPSGKALDLDSLCNLGPSGNRVIRVGLIGTFARWKGHEVFLRSLALQPPELAMRGYIIGGPIYDTVGSQWSLQELADIVKRLGLEGRVGFTGFVACPAQAIRALDIVVHASTEPEPFGLVIAEALAAAKPVITCGYGGAAEAIGRDSCAIVYKSSDSLSLAASLTNLAKDEKLRRKIGTAGWAHAQKNLNRDRLGPAFARLYESFANIEEPKS